MTTLLIVLAAIATVIALLVALGIASPRKAGVTRSAVVKATDAEVYDLLSSTRGFDTINPYKCSDPKLKITFAGPEAGVGAKFAFDGKEGKGTQTIVAVEENRLVRNQIDLGFVQPQLDLNIEPTNDGTKVTWNMVTDMGNNPLKRLMGRFMDKMLGPKYELGLANIQKHFA